MGEPQSPELRIGDPEREEALRVLGEHLSVGRLTVDEYGERAARASAARTRGEVDQLFTDLPPPHPRLDLQPWVQTPGQQLGQSTRPQPPAIRGSDMSPAQRVSSALVPLSGILAIVLFFSVPGMTWVIFLLPAAVAMISGAVWGGQHRHDRNRRR